MFNLRLNRLISLLLVQLNRKLLFNKALKQKHLTKSIKTNIMMFVFLLQQQKFWIIFYVFLFSFVFQGENVKSGGDNIW